jgi:DNA repair exonuclease SbcCD nuclease subunit
MKFIYFQDTHIKGINPINRKGDYYQEIMAKVKETITIAKEMKVECIIHGGDLFDSAIVSNLMVDEFIDAVEQAGIKWYILPGTHDEIGHNWELSKGSSLAHIFRRSKLINQLTTLKEDTVLGTRKDIIQGFKYYHNIEKDIKENGLTCKCPNYTFKIAITHAFITLQPFLPQVMHVVAKDIKTDFDVVLVAHYHAQWGIKELNGVKFVSLGCLGRTSIDEVKITPKIAYIDTETREIRLIPLTTAKIGKEVFNLTKIEIAKKFEQDIDNFIRSLDNVKFQSLDLRGLVEFLAKENNVEKEVKDCVIQRIGENEND